MRRYIVCHGACALIALTLSTGVCAQETPLAAESVVAPAAAFRSPTNYLQVHTGLTYTDNVLLTRDYKRGEYLASAGFDVDYTRKGTLFDLDSRGAINWVDYLEHTYNSIASGALNARATLGKQDGLLQWAAWETFGQLDTDPLAAPNPVNVENVNYFTTGPLLNCPFGTYTRLSVRALYSDSYYQKSPFDSHSYDVGAALSHELSASSSIALDIDSRRTQFRYPLLATDYDIRSAFLGYTAEIARARFNVEAGYTTLHFHGSRFGSPLFTAGLNRRISPSSTVYLQGQVGYSTDAESIRSGAGLIAPGAAFVGASTPNPLKQESISAGWEFQRARTSVSIFSVAARQRYVRQEALNQNIITLQVLAVRRLTPTLSAVISLHHETQKYLSLGPDVHQTGLIAGFSRTFTRVGLSLRYQRFRRSGSSFANNTVAVYDENRVGLYITYDLLGHHVTPTALVGQ